MCQIIKRCRKAIYLLIRWSKIEKIKYVDPPISFDKFEPTSKIEDKTLFEIREIVDI